MRNTCNVSKVYALRFMQHGFLLTLNILEAVHPSNFKFLNYRIELEPSECSWFSTFWSNLLFWISLIFSFFLHSCVYNLLCFLLSRFWLTLFLIFICANCCYFFVHTMAFTVRTRAYAVFGVNLLNLYRCTVNFPLQISVQSKRFLAVRTKRKTITVNFIT